ncbi:PIN domain-like protein [Suillus subalutaceus]|uniref:PIN domain-like protein n=1 Tax=Suillus subalutaceus TaxID=48586 RepID=UPI001B87FF61|nr:PIN domain-like protein [Suillus subalutaceus]KAG1872924.1 PIN domain-like protein [Suillus subalutaceus]
MYSAAGEHLQQQHFPWRRASGLHVATTMLHSQSPNLSPRGKLVEQRFINSLTIPTYFNNSQRQAAKDAATITYGLNTKAIARSSMPPSFRVCFHHPGFSQSPSFRVCFHDLGISQSLSFRGFPSHRLFVSAFITQESPGHRLFDSPSHRLSVSAFITQGSPAHRLFVSAFITQESPGHHLFVSAFISQGFPSHWFSRPPSFHVCFHVFSGQNGNPRLWERVASAADNRTLKQLAVFKLKTEEIDGERKVKLFKIGIDASAWMHSVCAVFQFNHAGAGKSPELRTLFFQLGTLLKLPLHVVFVFNGLKHLPEKGRMVRNSPHWLTCDFQRMLELFGFQWIEAPGEAEAKLAAMNAHGVIDAAMTEDSDILIFGAPCIIRSTKKDKDYLNVEVEIMMKECLVCGIKIAHKVVQHSKIGQEMLHAFLSLAPELFSEQAKELVMDLRSMLATDPYHFLGRRYKAVADSIPLEFP